MRRTHRPAGVALLIAAVVSVVAACAPTSDDALDVAVQLADFSIALDRDTVPAGPVTFVVRNEGPSVHEIEVFSGARPGQTLPVEQSVADTTGLELVDEVENLLPGSTTQLTVDLEPGTYVILCNLPVHYDNGMWTTLTVTEG